MTGTTGSARLPEPQATVAGYVRRWADRGLIDADTRERLVADLRADVGAGAGTTAEVTATNDATTVPERSSTIDRVLEAAKTLVFESLGYLGAALSIGAIFVLLDVGDWSDVAHLILLAITAVVAGAGTFLLTPPTSGTTRRLAAVTALTSVLATAGFLVLALQPDCVTFASGTRPECTYAQEFVLPLAMAVPVLILAVALYARHRHLLTHVAMGAATVATLAVVANLLAGRDAPDAEQLMLGTFLGVVAAVWVWAAETDRLEPAWFGTFAASGVLFAAIAMITDYDPFFGSENHVTILASLAVAAAFAIVGTLGARVRLTIVGAIGLLVTVPATLMEVLGLSGRATALVLLPVGIVLMVWAIRAGRRQLTSATQAQERRQIDRSTG